MTRPDEDLWLIKIAWGLDRLRWVPRSVLAELVTRSGACMEPWADGDLPLWNEEYLSDRPSDLRGLDTENPGGFTKGVVSRLSGIGHECTHGK